MKESHRSLLLKEKGQIILAGILFAFIHKTQRGKCRDTHQQMCIAQDFGHKSGNTQSLLV